MRWLQALCAVQGTDLPMASVSYTRRDQDSCVWWHQGTRTGCVCYPSQQPLSFSQLRNQKDASQSRGQESQGPSSSRHRRYEEPWTGGGGAGGPQTWTSAHCPSPRSSVCRLSSREKISLQDLSKERRPGGAGELSIRDEDEGEEGPTGGG